MKLKKDPVKPKGIFEGVVFAMVLGPISFKKKEVLRKKITANDGTISYLVTKKCNFVIYESDKDASNYGFKTAQKLGIPIVPSSYVDTCLAEQKLVSTDIYAMDKTVEHSKKLDDEFKNGKVSAKCGNELLMSSPKKSSFGTTKQLKQWSFMDNKGPDFHSHPFNVAKFTVLKGLQRRNGDVPFCVIEIHTSKEDEKTLTSFHDPEKPKFCVFVDFGILSEANTVQKNKGIKSSVQTCRFTNSRNAAMDCYSQLHKSYTSPPHTFLNWPRNETIPPYIGSPEFFKIRESWILKNSNLDVEVQKLVIHLWRESCKHLEDILVGKISDIQFNDVNKAESILLQLHKEVTDKLPAKLSQNTEQLSKKYYNLINQKTQQQLTCKAAISQQRQLLQLIKDVLTVSEGNLHEVDSNSVLTIYKSLACWVTHLKADSDEFAAVKEKLFSAGNGDSENTLDVINIFAVNRPAEDIGFAFDMCNRQFLFHGSNPHNILGILSRGLLLHKNDYTEDDKVKSLGSGIYFSPSSSASAKYSAASTTTGARFMVFAEVALGSCFITDRAMPELEMPPNGYQSVQGIPRDNSSSSTFQAIEYAVFQECQQRLAYLIEFSTQNDTLHIPQDPIISSAVIPMEVDDNSTVSQEEKTFAYDLCDKLLFAKDNKAQYGLQGVSSNPIPLESVHIRASIVDLASKVVIFQEYVNPNQHSIEAKYVFPLDDLAAVCGFEAFINEKHVVGVIEEKEKAHKQYREAIAEGHGAFLMDESGQDVFTIKVGNLPANSRVVIKITYVAELKTENEHIVFDLSGCVVGDSNKGNIMENTTPILPTLKSSLQIGIEMPFDIRRIVSPNHRIIMKKTDTMASVKLCKDQNIANGFQLWIDLAEVHVPRMWVEKSENDAEVEACMLTFYPQFFDEERETGTVIIMIDASNSMQMNAFQSAQTIALLILHHIRDNWKFNVIFFGSIYKEFYPVPQLKTTENANNAIKFILGAKPNFGCTDLTSALRSYFLLPPQDSEGPQNVFLVSDGNISYSALVLQNVAKHSSETRMFTFGIGSSRLPCNQHLMKILANKGCGAYEYFDDQMKSKWRNKIKQQLYKASQPALTDIRVEWQQLDDDPIPPVQAPCQILSLFNGARQVIYGFVAHCSMATLTAKVNNTTLSTVVSTSELSMTKGCLLHSLTARAIIRDWSDGFLDADAVKDEATKTSMNPYIVSLSQKHGILSSLTSYIAIEKRKEGYTGSSHGPSMLDLLNDEIVDKLSYIEYDEIEDSGNDIFESASQTDIPLFGVQIPKDIENANESPHRQMETHIDNLMDTMFDFLEPEPLAVKAKPSLFGESTMSFGNQMTGVTGPINFKGFGSPKTSPMTQENMSKTRLCSKGLPESSSLFVRPSFSSSNQTPMPQRFPLLTTTDFSARSVKAAFVETDSKSEVTPGTTKGMGSSTQVLFGPKQSVSAFRAFKCHVPLSGGGSRFPSRASFLAEEFTIQPLAYSGEFAPISLQADSSPRYAPTSPAVLHDEEFLDSIPKSFLSIPKGIIAKKKKSSFGSPPTGFSLNEPVNLSKNDEVSEKSLEDYNSDNDDMACGLFDDLPDLAMAECLGLPQNMNCEIDGSHPVPPEKCHPLQSATRDGPPPLPFRSLKSFSTDDYIRKSASSGMDRKRCLRKSKVMFEKSSTGSERFTRPKPFLVKNLLGLKLDPLKKFIMDGKKNLPLCFALIKAISNCPWTNHWSNKIWIFLKEGSMFKECELLALQSELDSLAKNDFVEKGTFHPMSEDIWRHQTAHGYFTMDCLDQWIYDGYASKITKILDNAGLLSLGGKRTEILRMCATIAAGLVFWKNVFSMAAVIESISDSGAIESEADLQEQFSDYLEENFNTKSVVMLLKAFAYIMWVYKRNPLLFKSLQLGSKEKVYTWEAFLMYYFTN